MPKKEQIVMIHTSSLHLAMYHKRTELEIFSDENSLDYKRQFMMQKVVYNEFLHNFFKNKFANHTKH